MVSFFLAMIVVLSKVLSSSINTTINIFPRYCMNIPLSTRHCFISDFINLESHYCFY